MARAPSYDFERRERAKAKDAKRAAKTQAKREKKDGAAPSEQANLVIDQTDAATAEDKAQRAD